MTDTTSLACRCGQVRLEVRRDPIIVAECHCTSCRDAAGRMARLEGAPPVAEPNGGTRFVMYRKDRIAFLAGTEHLKAFRLTPASTTRRVIATCCNTPLFLEFKGGHWLSLYANLWPRGSRPHPELRTMTTDRTDTTALETDIPHGRRATLGFYARLLGAWIAMGFRSPRAPVSGEIAL